MELIVFGLNHRTAPLEVREHWALSGDRHRATLRCLSDKIDDSEHVILCTCNRTEFYSIVPVDSSPLGPQIALSPDQTEILDGSRRGIARVPVPRVPIATSNPLRVSWSTSTSIDKKMPSSTFSASQAVSTQ